MKENITVELKSKEALAYDQEQVKEWMDDLVHLITGVIFPYESYNVLGLRPLHGISLIVFSYEFQIFVIGQPHN